MKYEIALLTLQFTIILNNILQVTIVISVLMNSNSMFNDNQHSYLSFLNITYKMNWTCMMLITNICKE